MANLGEDDPPRRPPNETWQSRYEAGKPLGVGLDPSVEPEPNLAAYPTDYAPTHLLVSSSEHLDPITTQLNVAARQFGWSVRIRRIRDDDGATDDGEDVDLQAAQDSASSDRASRRIPPLYRAEISQDPKEG